MMPPPCQLCMAAAWSRAGSCCSDLIPLIESGLRCTFGVEELECGCIMPGAVLAPSPAVRLHHCLPSSELTAACREAAAVSLGCSRAKSKEMKHPSAGGAL